MATLIVISKLLQMNILSEKKLIKSLTVSAVIISVSILISPFGLGYKGYDYIFSFRGLFGYANFVSGCLLGILPILMYLYKGRIRVVLILMDYVSLLLLGSKASVVGGTGIIVIMLCYCLKYELSISLRALLKQKKIRIIFSVIISCLAGVMGIYLSKQIQYFQCHNIVPGRCNGDIFIKANSIFYRQSIFRYQLSHITQGASN